MKHFEKSGASFEEGSAGYEGPLRILMGGSLPLAAPWNGADKNLGRLLVYQDKYNSFVVHTSLEEQWPVQRVTPIRSQFVKATPTTGQKLMELAYLMRYGFSTDLVHLVASLYDPPPLVGDYFRTWSRLSRRPIVHTIPSLGDSSLASRNLPGEATIVISEYARRKLEALGVPNVHRAPPMLETGRLCKDDSRAPEEALRRELSLGGRAVLYATHYGERSGMRETIRALSALGPEFRDVILVLAPRSHPWQDAAAERDALLQLANEAGVAGRVRVLEKVDDVSTLIKACAVTVLVPGELSGKMDLPLIVLESLMLGRPVLVSDFPPVNEALFGGGYALPYGDVRLLSAALSRLLRSPALRDRLSWLGREQVLEYCDPDRVVSLYHEIYRQVLKKHGWAYSQRHRPRARHPAQEPLR